MPTNIVNTHKDLDVWKLSMDLAEKLYRITNSLPSDEKFGMTSQIKRAATSIPMNIAEGAGRGSTATFIHFLYIAQGSLSEIETQLELCLRLNYLDDIEVFSQDMILIRRKLSNLIQALQKKQTSKLE